jgi:hypothetical protein
MNRTRALFVVAAGMLLLAGSCRKEVAPEHEWQHGFFEPVGGKPFTLTSGLTIRFMYGADDLTRASELPLAMGIRNAADGRTTSTFPAGLVFTPTDLEYAYMILLQDFRFSVPGRNETTILLPTYSCNEGLYDPDEESFYRTDIQVWERELNELFDLVDGKRLEGDTAVPLAQEALWQITEGDSLTDTMRVQLRNLP